MRNHTNLRSSEPLKLDDILEHANGLSDIQARAGILAMLTPIVNKQLSSPLKKHVRIANYRNGILVLQASSASWLTRLKYEQSELLSALREKALPSLSSIQYQISPDIAQDDTVSSPSVEAKTDVERKLTKASAELLSNLADKAPEALKKQLIKLANHAK